MTPTHRKRSWWQQKALSKFLFSFQIFPRSECRKKYKKHEKHIWKRTPSAPPLCRLKLCYVWKEREKAFALDVCRKMVREVFYVIFFASHSSFCARQHMRTLLLLIAWKCIALREPKLGEKWKCHWRADREKANVKIKLLGNNRLKLSFIHIPFSQCDFYFQMRYTKKVSMWPVGLITKYGVSSPIVRNGTVSGFYDGWIGGRKFPVDMAGFAVNVNFLLSRPNASMPYKPG